MKEKNNNNVPFPLLSLRKIWSCAVLFAYQYKYIYKYSFGYYIFIYMKIKMK